MGSDIVRTRESIGRFYSTARMVKERKRLSLFDFLNIVMFMKYGLKALPLSILMSVVISRHSFTTHKTVNSSVPTALCMNRNHQNNSNVYIQNVAFVCVVASILLIVSGIESNPGPSSNDSFSTASSNSSDFSTLIDNTVSFIHLNVQSLVPKLPIVSTEFMCHDILAFTESWLKPSTCDNDICIPSYQNPYRRDRPDRIGGGVIVFVQPTLTLLHGRIYK